MKEVISTYKKIEGENVSGHPMRRMGREIFEGDTCDSVIFSGEIPTGKTCEIGKSWGTARSGASETFCNAQET